MSFCITRASIIRNARHLRVASRSLVNQDQRRYLDLQEYQSKQLLYNHGVTVQKFKVVSSTHEANQVISPDVFGKFKNSSWSGMEDDISKVDEFVIKAQVLAGGRGKGRFIESGLDGGVQLTKDPKLAIDYSNLMLGNRLVTKQTDSNGILVDKVMIADAVRLDREYYLALVLDRNYPHGIVMVASPHGGVDIEEVAEKDDTLIRKFLLPLDYDLDMKTARRMAINAFDINMNESDVISQCADQMIKLFSLFKKLDASQIEINPLGVTKQGQVVAVDAKLAFDENARFRQRWLDDLEEMNSVYLDERDQAARKHNLNFIGLDGNIGCLVNGAGLAMATMDIIKLHGGKPANFLDIGGGADAKQTLEALRIISSDDRVKAILINIFGGITRCDLIAEGLISAISQLGLSMPLVCRLQGSQVEKAKHLLESNASSLNLLSLDDLDQAAKYVVQLSSG